MYIEVVNNNTIDNHIYSNHHGDKELEYDKSNHIVINQNTNSTSTGIQQQTINNSNSNSKKERVIVEFNNDQQQEDESSYNGDDIKIHNDLIDRYTIYYFNIFKYYVSSYKGAFAVLLYGTISLCQTIFNKMVMSTFKFEASNIMLFFQMILSIVVLRTLKHYKILEFNTTINRDIIKKLTPLSICYVTNVMLGLDSLKALNIPMYSALKRLVAVIILFMEYFILGKVSSNGVIMSVLVMVVGAVVAGVTDLSFNGNGYVLVLVSCFFQATYLVYVKKTARDMSTYDMLYYNSTLSLPFIGVLILLMGEIPTFLNYQYLYDSDFQLYFIMSIVLGFILNFCIFFCTSVNSALTTTVTGQVKNVASTIIGAIIFKDIIIHPINILGLVVNMMGSIWYSFLKLNG